MGQSPNDHLPTPRQIRQRTDEMRKLSRDRENKLNKMARDAFKRFQNHLVPLKESKDTGPIHSVPAPVTPLPPVARQFDMSECETVRMPAVRLPQSIVSLSPVRRIPWRYEDRTADPEQLLDVAISKFIEDFKGALPTPLYIAEWCFIWLQIRNKLLFCSAERGVYTHKLGDVLIALDPGAEPYQVTAPIPIS